MLSEENRALRNDNRMLIQASVSANRTIERLTTAETKGPEPAPEGSYDIFVKLLDGKPTTMHVKETYEVAMVKAMIWRKADIQPSQQAMIFAGRQLENDLTLKHYGIKKESTLHLVLHLRGC